jgi:hypothetical protein
MTMFTRRSPHHRRLQSVRQGVAGFLAGVFLFALVAPALAAAVTLPAGTTVPLEFAQGLDSRYAQKGDRVNLHVREDVIVNGEMVIAKDAPATARVKEVVKPKPFGQKAMVKLYQVRVRAVDGSRIQVGQYDSGKRLGNSSAIGAEAGGLILLGPIGLAAGAFLKGGHLAIKPGAAIVGAVQHDTVVRVGAH